MPDVSATIAGLRLRNPTMLASGFLDETGGTLLRVFKAGAGAVVTKSIGPKPRGGNTNPTVVELEVGMLNAMGLPNPGIEDFGSEVTVALEGGAAVVGSVFGKDPDEYAAVAKRLQSYGVHAIELNLSCPHAKGLGTEIAEDPEAVREFTAAVKAKVSVPVMPKLSPNVPDIASFARAAEDGGADAIVAINTLKAMAISPELRTPILANRVGGLSGPAIRPVGVRCVYEIFEAVDVPIVGVGGVETGKDALEYVMAGARAVQIGTALATHGLAVFEEVTAGIAAFLEERGVKSLASIVGAAHG
jgi:dihydroorotate dehydrogenase (NAD+) catalytic subunit